MYPALAILQALGKRANPVLWVGGTEGMEADLIKRAGLKYQAIPAAGVHGVGVRSLPKNLSKLMRGYFASRQIIRKFAPDVILFTGGYVAVPMALAGHKLPSVLYVPDIEPGLALKTLSRFSARIAVTASETRQFYSRKEQRLVITGYPIRKELTKWTKIQGRKTLNLNADEPVFLVLGGSKGARSINHALLPVLEQLLAKTQIIHITGALDWQEVDAARQRLSVKLQNRYHATAYLHEEMGAALAASDLVLSRAGASTLGEYPLFGLPAILVPYPHAWRYQKVNADHLVDKGAALMIADEKLAEQLVPTVLSLLGDKKRLAAMSTSMKKLHSPKAAESIANLICELAKKGAR